MKNYDIMAITTAYAEWQKDNKDSVKLPAAIAWKRRLNFKHLLDARSVIEEALKEVSEKYSDDEHSEGMKDGEGRKVKPAYMEEFAKAQMEILSQDTEVTISKIKIGEIEGISLSDSDMDTLAFMIEEEEG